MKKKRRKVNLGHVGRGTEGETRVGVDGRLTTVGEVHGLPKALEPTGGGSGGDLAEFLVEDLAFALSKSGDLLLDILKVLRREEGLKKLQIEAERVLKRGHWETRQ